MIGAALSAADIGRIGLLMHGPVWMQIVLMICMSMRVLDFNAGPMHVRHAKYSGQRLRNSLQRHSRQCEREKQSGEPGSIHANESVCSCLRPMAIMSLGGWTESSFSSFG